jgi:hypothetical protein
MPPLRRERAPKPVAQLACVEDDGRESVTRASRVPRRSTPDLRSTPLRRLALCMTSATTPSRVACRRRSSPERRSPGDRRSSLAPLMSVVPADGPGPPWSHRLAAFASIAAVVPESTKSAHSARRNLTRRVSHAGSTLFETVRRVSDRRRCRAGQGRTPTLTSAAKQLRPATPTRPALAVISYCHPSRKGNMWPARKAYAIENVVSEWSPRKRSSAR